MESDDITKLKQEFENLSKVMQEIGSAIYQRNAPQQNVQQDSQNAQQDYQTNDSTNNEEKTVDADFTEEPKKK